MVRRRSHMLLNSFLTRGIECLMRRFPKWGPGKTKDPIARTRPSRTKDPPESGRGPARGAGRVKPGTRLENLPSPNNLRIVQIRQLTFSYVNALHWACKTRFLIGCWYILSANQRACHTSPCSQSSMREAQDSWLANRPKRQFPEFRARDLGLVIGLQTKTEVERLGSGGKKTYL